MPPVLRDDEGASKPAARAHRLLLIGYFEGLDAERGIAWRAAEARAVRKFLRLGLEDASPDHSTISRTRRLRDVETHRAVFTWIQPRLVEAGLLTGKTIGIDATPLEANAAMRSILRRDTGETYDAFLTRLAKASGITTPTREALTMMRSHEVACLPVVKDGRLVGVLSERDLIIVAAKLLDEELSDFGDS